MGRNEWDTIFQRYVRRVVSPDGRDTFESTDELVREILGATALRGTETVIDMGCGWGNITIPLAVQAGEVIGIDPSEDNLKIAQNRKGVCPIHFICGSFEKPHYDGLVDTVISSLAFHQVRYAAREKALQNVSDLLKPGGRYVLCDTFMLFDAEHDAMQFNDVYRYLLPRTVPTAIYQKYVAPKMEEGHVYTWKEMQEYTPENNRLYSLAELQSWTGTHGLMVRRMVTFCPFFGIVVMEKRSN